MKNLEGKTFTELITAEPLDIRGLGDTPLTPHELSGLFSVVNYRYENMLPTTTHTDRGARELCGAICNTPDYDILAHAIVGRLWEMGVERSSRAAARL